MIDSFSPDFLGWARFSEGHPPDTEPLMRYRLGRACTSKGHAAFLQSAAEAVGRSRPGPSLPRVSDLSRVVFVMLNPSTADAFDPDRTVSECMRFAVMWHPHVDIVEAVNLFAFRTPYPAVLKRSADRGNDAGNNEQILEACTGAELVIMAWGNDGALDNRDVEVKLMLDRAGISLHHLGRTKGGYPKHPLARGKHRIPRDQQPIPA